MYIVFTLRFFYLTDCKLITMKEKDSYFTSPNYPQEYPQHTYCLWNISVPHGYMVELTFHHFDVDCTGSHVRIYDGSTVDSSMVIDT